MTNSNNKRSEASRPVHTVRYGAIKAAVWRNILDNGNASRPMYNLTVSRAYRDGDEWKDSSSFGYEDLLVLSKALNDCHSFIHEQLVRDNQEQREQKRQDPPRHGGDVRRK
jgi:hypothetical protein